MAPNLLISLATRTPTKTSASFQPHFQLHIVYHSRPLLRLKCASLPARQSNRLPSCVYGSSGPNLLNHFLTTIGITSDNYIACFERMTISISFVIGYRRTMCRSINACVGSFYHCNLHPFYKVQNSDLIRQHHVIIVKSRQCGKVITVTSTGFSALLSPYYLVIKGLSFI
jgi:hypothetical protein